MEHVSEGPRLLTPADAGVVAELLDRFNREFDTPTPGPAVLAPRVERLLATGSVLALVTGSPAIALAVLTLRPNVWYDGSVALLDELYVAPDRRGQGVGSALLAAAEAEVRGRGAEVVEINVDSSDTGARRFYQRHGYANTDPSGTIACCTTSANSTDLAEASTLIGALRCCSIPTSTGTPRGEERRGTAPPSGLSTV